MTWAASWRSNASPSSSLAVTMDTWASSSMTAARSLIAPFTRMASAALARPGPMSAASPVPETGPSNVRTLPSGNVMATMKSVLCSGARNGGEM